MFRNARAVVVEQEINALTAAQQFERFFGTAPEMATSASIARKMDFYEQLVAAMADVNRDNCGSVVGIADGCYTIAENAIKAIHLAERFGFSKKDYVQVFRRGVGYN
jgi:hypothetical protein